MKLIALLISAGQMRRQRGQTMVIFALVFVVLIGAVGIAVDGAVGFFYSAQAERAAGAAALAGVPYMPDSFCSAPTTCSLNPNASPIVSSSCSVASCTGAYAIDRALVEAKRNGYDTADTANGVTVVVVRDSSSARQLQVQVTRTAPVFFMQALGLASYQVKRLAIAGYKAPIQLGQPGSQLGSTVSSLGTGNAQYFLRQEGWSVTRSEGDAFTPNCSSKGNGTDIQDVHGISLALGTESSDTYTPTADSPGCGSVTGTLNRGGYNYLVTIPKGKTGKVRVYNTAFAPDNLAGGQNNAAIHNNCENVKARSGTSCNANGNNYYFHEEDNGSNYISAASASTMMYTLYQIKNPFLRSNDVALTQLKVYPIDASGWNASPAATYKNLNTGNTITQTYTGNVASNMNVYHDWVDIANDPNIAQSKDDSRAAACPALTAGTSPASHRAASSGCIESLIPTNAYAAFSGGTLTEGTYRLRVDTLDEDGSVSNNGKSHKGYGVQVVDSTYASGSGTGCDTCTVSAMQDMAIYTPISSASFDIPIFELPSDYAGSTVRVFIFDPGDLSGSGNVDLSILKPAVGGSSPAAGAVASVSAGTLHIYNRGPARDGSQPGVASVATGELLAGTYRPSGVTQATFEATTSGTTNFNGHWIEIDIPIPNSYSSTPSGLDFWYLHYSIGSGSSATDTLTMTVDSVGSPVHIVQS